ncbi:hypothetical protein PPERSA_05465 [Pseudocohnilembus persalinus]|uniref:Tubulin-specific chaperone A n=1 Tax=Pseudocohnilembus persalinus TaxID=266149 RepID=A0A0V0R8R2_PSEPJ|nr:hypothetical protein PPERSA_05465 [Pseudocohnilembus persalinus]|eukprot:KRX10645.1 hypothetical protein PPERSA_05465 [Pseudocohnilembus persalinus]
MGNCFGGGHQSDELQQQQQNGPQKQRREITETERIEIDLKKTRDTLQRNKQKVSAQIDTVETVIKKLISEQRRDKAKKEFQKKQLYEKYLDNIEDKSIVIQKMIHEVKSAQMDKECMEVMKNANNFLKDIQKAIDIDDAQDII